jgi:LmbE family N-acetylglucosaminyl deacetylase
MNALPFAPDKRRPLTVLCLGAHSDDIEIGCGGTIMRLLAERPRTSVHWVVMTGQGERAREARRSAGRMLRGAHASHVRIESFRDGFLPYVGAQVKEVFEDVKRSVEPDVIFTHYGNDRHQDHRLMSELTWNTFRSHMILEYEIPKYDGDLGQPNLFVSLPASIRRRKLAVLMTAFPTQRTKSWFTPATFEGLMRLRGIESGAPDGYAEAFHARKVMLSP